jgi:hypothetical protein
MQAPAIIPRDIIAVMMSSNTGPTSVDVANCEECVGYYPEAGTLTYHLTGKGETPALSMRGFDPVIGAELAEAMTTYGWHLVGLHDPSEEWCPHYRGAWAGWCLIDAAEDWRKARARELATF